MDDLLSEFLTETNEGLGLLDIRKAIEAGANEYIMKPFDSDILQSKFAQVGLV